MAGDLRIDRYQVTALAAAHHEAEPGEQFQRMVIRILAGRIQVTDRILGNGGQQRPVAVGPAGRVEVHEPSIIRTQECRDGADHLIRVNGTPDQAG